MAPTLPAARVLVGRDADTQDLAALLERERLVTLHGPGGVGKTQLARAVVNAVGMRWAQGAAWADLADLRSPDGLPQVLSMSIGAQYGGTADPEAALINFLAEREMLLVLDNAEHLVPEISDLVAKILDSAPRVTVLATSRRSLDVDLEMFFPTRPLTTEYAIEMFIACAQRRGADTKLWNQPQRDLVAQLCVQAGNLPLAIEMLAARTRTLGLETIQARQEELLRIGRQQSPRDGRRAVTSSFDAVLDGSWQLCTETQRLLWARLSVFVGSFSLSAAEHVCAGGPEDSPDDYLPEQDIALELVDLVNASVVEVAPTVGGIERYRLLYPLQQYGNRKLAEHGETERMRERHWRWVRDWTDEQVYTWFGEGEREFLLTLREETPNIRAALTWAEENNPPGDVIALNVARIQTPMNVGTLEEWGRRWPERLAARTHEPLIRAQALIFASYAAVCQGSPEAYELLDKAREISESIEDADQRAMLELFMLTSEGARHTFSEVGSGRSVELMGEAHRRAQSLPAEMEGDRAIILMWYAIASVFFAEQDTADKVSAEFLRYTEEAKSTHLITWAWWTRAVYLWRHGDAVQADELLQKAVRLQLETADYWGPLWTVAVSSWIAAGIGEYRRAAELGGAGCTLMFVHKIHLEGLGPLLDNFRMGQQAAKEALGETAYYQTYKRGGGVPNYTAAAQLVLDIHSLPTLSTREREVAELAAHGVSNRDIAERLVISGETVSSHLRSIYSKTGVGRDGLAAWLRDFG